MLFWHAILCSSSCSHSLVTDAAVLNILSPSGSGRISQFPDGTNLTVPEGVPNGFDAIIQEPRGPRLRHFLCFMAAVEVIGEHLALGDFTGRIPAQGWSQSDTVISLSTQGLAENSIQRRYAIWGIFKALGQMVQEKNFRSAIFRLEWRGTLVGKVAFYPADPVGVDAGGQPTNINRLSFLPPPNGTDTRDSALYDPTDVEDLGLEANFFWLGPPTQPLDFYGIFMNLLGVLMQAAEQSENRIIRETYTTSVGHGVQITIFAGSSSKPPTRRPFLTYRWIIKTVALIPRILAPMAVSDAFRIEMLLYKVPFGMILVEPVRSMTVLTSSNIQESANMSPSSIEARDVQLKGIRGESEVRAE